MDFTFLRTDSYKLRGEEPQSTSCLLPSLQGEETEAQNGRSLGCTHTAPEENSAQSERLPVFMEQCSLSVLWWGLIPYSAFWHLLSIWDYCNVQSKLWQLSHPFASYFSLQPQESIFSVQKSTLIYPVMSLICFKPSYRGSDLIWHLVLVSIEKHHLK